MVLLFWQTNNWQTWVSSNGHRFQMCVLFLLCFGQRAFTAWLESCCRCGCGFDKLSSLHTVQHLFMYHFVLCSNYPCFLSTLLLLFFLSHRFCTCVNPPFQFSFFSPVGWIWDTFPNKQNKFHTLMYNQLTADGEECVGLFSIHCCNTLQSVEASPADVHPALHFCFPKPGAEQGDGDDVLLLGGIQLLRAPGGRRLHLVEMGSWTNSFVVPCGEKQASPPHTHTNLCRTYIPPQSLLWRLPFNTV